MPSFENMIIHSENGIAIGGFSTDSVTYEADIYAHTIDVVVFFSQKSQSVSIYDLKTKKIIKEIKTTDVKQILVSNDSKSICLIYYSKNLKYHSVDTDFFYEISHVERGQLTNHKLYILNGNILRVYDISNNFEISNEFPEIKDFFAFENILICILNSVDSINKIMVYKNDQLIIQKVFEQIHNFDIVPSTGSQLFLINITTEYLRNSYFGVTELYLLDIENACFERIVLQDPILSYGFTSKNIYVCYGPQPSNVSLICQKKLKVIKTFPPGIRNKVYFNPHENLVCFAGFDNLSGNLEIHGNQILSKMNVLGASKVIWNSKGTHFCVCVTNEMKIDNQISVYDYFGNLEKKMQYKNLKSVEVFKKDVSFPFVPLPEPKTFEIKEVEAYVPPHLRKQNPKKNSEKIERVQKKLPKGGYSSNLKPKNQSFGKNPKQVAENKQYNPNKFNIAPKNSDFARKNLISKNADAEKDIKNKLLVIEANKRRIKGGESLSIDEMNLILSEKKLRQALDKYKK